MKIKAFTSFVGMAFLALGVNTVHAEGAQYEVYGKAGVPGVGVGVGVGLNEHITLRSDVTTAGRINRDFNHRGFDFDAEFKSDKLNVYADYFPFIDNGFRVTTGLGFGSTQVNAVGRSEEASTQTFRIGGKRYQVDLNSNDTLNVSMKYPKASPYFGLGWGHNIQQKSSGQWGFTADLGVYVGKPKTTVSMNSDLRDRLAQFDQNRGLVTADAYAEVDRRVEREKVKIQEKIEKYKAVPAISVGVSYNF